MSAPTDLPVCERHPDRETRLACARCGRPACAECVGSGPCPACRAEVHAARTGRRTGRPLVATTIIVVCVLVHLATVASPGLATAIISNGVQQQDLIDAGQWWRVLTAAFLHADLTHLAFNMFALYVLGFDLERSVGSGPFAALYLASAAAGAVAYQLLGGPAPALGASGAIFGLFGVWLVSAWRARRSPRGRAGLRQILVLLAINGALPLVLPGIAWQAHVGGFAAGVVIGAAWSARPTSSGAAVRRVAVALAVLLAMLSVVW